MTIERRLAEHPFLRGIDAALLAELVPFAVESTFVPGIFLFREGDEASRFYLIEQGSASLEVHVPGKNVTRLAIARAGETVGLSWLFPPAKAHLDVRVLDMATVISLDAAKLRRAMDEDHDLGYALSHRLLRVAYERLERIRVQHLDLYR